MSLVRFVFFAHGHTKPHTGYLAVRTTVDDKWTLSSRSLTRKELTTLEGEGLTNGGKVFLEEMHHFIAYWATAQADAIEKHRLWSSAKLPQQKLTRPGFRPITAEKQWNDYKRDTSAEIKLIQQDYETALRELREGGWISDVNDTPFPTFMFGDPWNATVS